MNPPTEQAISATPGVPARAEVRQVLTAIISELCEVDPAQIGPDFPLASGRLRSSLGRATLDAKIRRRLGRKLENLQSLRTMGEIEAALAGDQSRASAPAPFVPIDPPAEPGLPALPAKAPKPVALPPAAAGFSCGIDVESISALPETKDYWEETFYRTNFTAAEIAYCISQPNPRMHFAARWCAKEALKKCRPEYLPWAMNRIEVVRSGAGSPSLRVLAEEGERTPPVAMSLTHNEDWALAIVVSATETSSAPVPDLSGAPRRDPVAFALSLAAFACSILALIMALVHR
jgi:holo-[acyl-carrier protein] synthase